MNKYKGIFIGLLLALGLGSCNQNDTSSKVVINEVLTNNEANFEDDYGIHNAWIELFNKSYGSVDIAGYLLKACVTQGDTMTYIIPKGDVLTLIEPRQHALLWADGQPNRGTFHTSLKFEVGKPVWVGLYDTGNKLLDEANIPALGKDLSYARIKDGDPVWEIKGENDDKYITPNTNNQTIEKNEKVEKFATHDPDGIAMSITAMFVVFCGLILLYICFRILDKSIFNRKKESQHAMKKGENEVYAAIAMALHEELGNVHDIESNVLTIHHIHSSWNDKY